MKKSTILSLTPLMLILWVLSTFPLYAGDIGDKLIEAVNKGNRRQVDSILERGDIYVAKTHAGQKALLYCAGANDLYGVKKLLDAGCDINTRAKGEKKGWTALSIAIEKGNDDIAALLIQRGAKLTLTPKKGRYAGWQPLQLAIEKGNLKLVQLLLEKGAKADVREKTRRMTPLMIAAATGNAELTTLLLKEGASVKLKDKKGWTALIHAVESGSLPTVQALVKAGADVNHRDKDYISVLQHASARVTQLRTTKNTPAHFEEIVPYLKKHGAEMIPRAK